MLKGFLDLLVAPVLLVWPRRGLEQQTTDLLLRRFCSGGRNVLFFKSGRSALSAVCEGLSRTLPGCQVLVPDYICNVVPRAVTRAGLKASTYATNERFEPDEDGLQARLTDPTVGAVVLASLFGADNTSAARVEWIRRVRPDVFIVLDDCQNLVLNRPVPADPRTVVVFSFNGKTIHGAMGGGVVFDGTTLGLEPPARDWRRDLRLEIAVCMVVLKQCWERGAGRLQRLRGCRRWKPPSLEYSHAAGRIHYDMDVQRIAKVSLVRALLELRRAPRTEACRKDQFAALRAFLERTGAGDLIPTECPERAPFVPVKLRDASLLTRLPWKGPYAVEGDPTRSLRPDVVCFKNVGVEQGLFGSAEGK